MLRSTTWRCPEVLCETKTLIEDVKQFDATAVLFRRAGAGRRFAAADHESAGQAVCVRTRAVDAVGRSHVGGEAPSVGRYRRMAESVILGGTHPGLGGIGGEMLRQFAVAVTLLGVSVVVGTDTASAGTGCSAQDELVTVAEAVASVDTRNYSEEDVAALPERVASVDQNGDGLLCVKKFAPNNGQDQKNGSGFSATMINDNRLGGNGPPPK
jgi:hypothetical protein